MSEVGAGRVRSAADFPMPTACKLGEHPLRPTRWICLVWDRHGGGEGQLAACVRRRSEGLWWRLAERLGKGKPFQSPTPHVGRSGCETFSFPTAPWRRGSRGRSTFLFAAFKARIGAGTWRLRRRFDKAEITDNFSAKDRHRASSGACA